MRKKLLILTILCFLFLFGCKNRTTTTEEKSSQSVNSEISISLNYSSFDLEINGAIRLIADVTNSSKTVVWTSSSPDVATVSKGYVTAYIAGTTTITASIDDVSATCVINVIEVEKSDSLYEVPVLHFESSITKASINYEIILSSSLMIEGNIIDSASISYSVSDDEILELEGNILKGKKVGVATVLATCVYKEKIYQKSITIEVVE